MEYAGLPFLVMLGCLYALSGLDDLFVDMSAWLRGCWPRHFAAEKIEEILHKEEKAIAIVVPAWEEGDVIARMLTGNVSQIDYQNYNFFVGVYPNDPATLAEVLGVSRASDKIHAVVGDRPGPTSKGQILNRAIEQVFKHEREHGSEFDAILMHDAEDVIHPLSLKLVNHCLDQYEFLQLPVFSLSRPFRHLVAGTYIDEFAEAHTKDLLVRAKLGAAVPSAGVGTALARGLVERIRAQNEGRVFNESSLTEDYELGIRAHDAEAKADFACVWYDDKETGEREFIATREYFPKTFSQSVRQKTRWIVGIAFQGSSNLGWHGSLVNRYFLARDRKAVLTNLATLFGYLALVWVGLYAWLYDPLPLRAAYDSRLLSVLFGVNIFFMCNRILQRHICVVRVYGPRGALAVFIRWPLAIMINACASLRAIRQHAMSRICGRKIAWAKTRHEIPDSLAPEVAVNNTKVLPAEPASTSVRGPAIKQVLLIFLIFAGMQSGLGAEHKCVRIYYDRVPEAKPAYHFGRIHALYLQNLLGHFPNVQQEVVPIQQYQSGDLDSCFAAIYLGTYYNNQVPKAFFEDFASTSRNVVWAGYNIWHYAPEKLRQLWGVEYSYLSKLDTDSLDKKEHYGFFKFYEYKGERFEKFARWNPVNPDQLLSAFEIAVLDVVVEPPVAEVISWAEHSTSGQRAPYVLRNRNHWYLGDSPFSFATEDDRYMIFADLLFDILDEPPRHPGKRPAVFRIEDVHCEVPLWQLHTLTDLLDRKQVPFAMSLIPIFADPHGINIKDISKRFSVMSQNALFVDYIKYAKQHGASFIYHGVTHQSGNMLNPFSGVSGDDFEFWDRVHNQPIRDDRPEQLVTRLEDGLKILDETGVTPVAWLTPHYQASPLDYKLFGQLFSWNVGRVVYFPFTAQQAKPLPAALAMDIGGAADNGRRLEFLQDLQVEYPPNLLPSGQFFPYEIFGDVYGQRIVPENVGNLQPYLNEQVLRTHNIDDMLRILRRNRVLRDVWGSFFVHAFYLGSRADQGVGRFPGDTKEFERLIDGARAYGYEFIDLAEFTRKHRHLKRPAPIERFFE